MKIFPLSHFNAAVKSQNETTTAGSPSISAIQAQHTVSPVITAKKKKKKSPVNMPIICSLTLPPVCVSLLFASSNSVFLFLFVPAWAFGQIRL